MDDDDWVLPERNLRPSRFRQQQELHHCSSDEEVASNAPVLLPPANTAGGGDMEEAAEEQYMVEKECMYNAVQPKPQPIAGRGTLVAALLLAVASIAMVMHWHRSVIVIVALPESVAMSSDRTFETPTQQNPPAVPAAAASSPVSPPNRLAAKESRRLMPPPDPPLPSPALPLPAMLPPPPSPPPPRRPPARPPPPPPLLLPTTAHEIVSRLNRLSSEGGEPSRMGAAQMKVCGGRS